MRPTMALPTGVSFVAVALPSGRVSIRPKPGSPHRFTLPRSANNLDATDSEKPPSTAYSPSDRFSFSATPINAITIDSGSRSLNSRSGCRAAMRFRNGPFSSSDIDCMMIVILCFGEWWRQNYSAQAGPVAPRHAGRWRGARPDWGGPGGRRGAPKRRE
jgi:hypothetical protein